MALVFPGPTDGSRRQWLLLFLLILLSQLGVIAWRQAAPPAAVHLLPPVKAIIEVTDPSAPPLSSGAVRVVAELGPISPRKVRINRATREELLACPGLGEAMVDRLLDARRQRPFADWDDLRRRVKGLGPARLDGLRQAGVELGSEGDE
jgi:hypothetical protein